MGTSLYIQSACLLFNTFASSYPLTSAVNMFSCAAYHTLHWQCFPPPQMRAGVQAGRWWALLSPAVRQLWWTKVPKAGCLLQWHPVWWDAARLQQQNPASQLGTDIPNDLPVTSAQVHASHLHVLCLFFARCVTVATLLAFSLILSRILSCLISLWFFFIVCCFLIYLFKKKPLFILFPTKLVDT